MTTIGQQVMRPLVGVFHL